MLYKECGFENNYMDYQNMESTFAMSAKRGVYAKFRKMLDKDNLMVIEHEVEFNEPTAKKGK